MRFHQNANAKSGVGPVESTRGNTSSISLLLERPVCLKIRLKELLFGNVTEIRQRNWLISVKLEDLWVSLCPIEIFDLYAHRFCFLQRFEVFFWSLHCAIAA